MKLQPALRQAGAGLWPSAASGAQGCADANAHGWRKRLWRVITLRVVAGSTKEAARRECSPEATRQHLQQGGAAREISKEILRLRAG